jgi:VWFA-related protein
MRSIGLCAPGRLSWNGHRFWAIFIAIGAALTVGAEARAQEPERPTFRSRVAVVPITAVVRDSRSRVVRDLRSDDFEVLEEGKPRRILEFSANADGPISIAVLYDTSGSMGLASNLAKGKAVVAQLIDGLDPQRDEMALFTFHKTLREEVPFTSNTAQLRRALEHVKPWGLTSLYDAVGETAKRLPERGATRRAIVVVSDGVDTSSALASREVAALASAIDVPVYVIAVVSPLDHPSHVASVVPEKATGGLVELADFTGGDVSFVSADGPSAAMGNLLTAMRHQYFLAIESSAGPGWYALEVKTKRRGVTVRARRAYSAGAPAVPSDLEPPASSTSSRR